MNCVLCNFQNSEGNRFCTECGWPLFQKTPHGDREVCEQIPVTKFELAPARDGLGRPLAYVKPETGKHVGRALVPGKDPKGVDKIPDFPSEEGIGNTRYANLSPDPFLAQMPNNVSCVSSLPRAASFGAARLVWITDEELLEWDLTKNPPRRTSLPSQTIVVNGKKLLTHGYKSYVNCMGGLFVHDGEKGAFSSVAGQNQPVGDMVIWNGCLVLCKLDGTVTIDGGNIALEFKANRLVTDGNLLAAVSLQGDVAVLYIENDVKVFKSHLRANEGHTVTQVWTIDGRVFVRVNTAQGDYIRFASQTPNTTPRSDAPISSERKLVAYNVSSSWETSRVVAYNGNNLNFYQFAGLNTPVINFATAATISSDFYLVKNLLPNTEQGGSLCVVYTPLSFGQQQQTLVAARVDAPAISKNVILGVHSPIVLVVPSGHCILVITYDPQNRLSIVNKLDLP